MRVMTWKRLAEVRTWGILGLAAWLAGTAAAFVAMSRGVVAESVEFKLADGTPIRGTIYRPSRPKKKLPAVVIVHGTATARQSCVPSLAIPLARNGCLALAIDVRGHGRSGGALPRRELHDPLAALDTLAEQPEVDAAIEAIKQHPLFEQKHILMIPQGKSFIFPIIDCIAVVGHSRGGWAAANTGYRRGDVNSVVSIGAAPGVCDTNRPRNFMVVTGYADELFPVERCLRTAAQASNGEVAAPGQGSGQYWAGTSRRLMKINDVNHFTELASPSLTRCVVQWVMGSLDIEAGRVPGKWLILVIAAVLTASLGGMLACSWVLNRVAGCLFGAPAGHVRNGSRIRLAAFFLALVLVVPAVAVLAPRLEWGPAYFAGPAVFLLAVMALAAWAIGSIKHQPEIDSSLALGAGWRLGFLALLLGMVWLGVPWGMTWVGLMPTPRRCLLAVALVPVLFPACLALAHGFRRLIAEGLYSGLAWTAIPVVLWYSYRWFSISFQPLFVVPIVLLGAAFVFPLPLWFLPGRRGMTLARAICHTGAAAWVLACHLPFVCDG